MDLGSIRYGAQIAAAASSHHLDPQLLAAVAAQETGGPGASSGNNIVGDGGHGRGVFQIDDRSWDFAKTGAAMDPASNADFAAGILSDNLQRYGGNVKAALSAYNSGSPTATGTTTTWGDGQTLGYADSVMRHYDALGGSTAAQLTADNGENIASVNSLSNLFSSATATGGSATTTTGSSSTTSASQGVAPAAAPTLQPLTPAKSYEQLVSSSSQIDSNTTSTMAGMIADGDVYDGDGDDA